MSSQSSQNQNSNETSNVTGATANSGTSTQNPWDVQTPYLTQAFQGASGALNTATGVPKPNQFVSQFTPDQLGIFQKMINTGTNHEVADVTQRAGSNLLHQGDEALTSGYGTLKGFTPTTMASILGDANAAANDPSVQGRIDASLRDARRSVSEQVLPQIARNAALGNNTNSSRTGVREGIVERGLADTTADTSADIRGAAFDRGLAASLQRSLAGDSNRLRAGEGLISGGNASSGLGVGANTQSVAQRGSLYDIANQGVAGQQAGSTAAINDSLARYGFDTSAAFDPIKNFYGIVGANNWGGSTATQGTSNTSGTTNKTGTVAQTTQPSTWDTIAKMMTAAGSFMPKM